MKYRSAVLTILFLLLSATAYSQTTYTWVGGGAAGDWNDPANWNVGVGWPGDGVSATLPHSAVLNAGAPWTIGSGTVSLADLTVSGGGTLTNSSGNALTVTNTTTLEGTIDGGGNLLSLADVTVDTSTTLTSTGQITISGTVGGTGNLAITTTDAGNPFNVPVVNALTGNLSITSGTFVGFQNLGDIVVSGNASFSAANTNINLNNAGTLNFGTLSYSSGGIVTIIEDSATTIAGTGGTADIHNITSSGAIVAGTLDFTGGTSTFSANGGASTVTFGDPVTISGNTTVNFTAASVTLTGAVDDSGGNTLALDAGTSAISVNGSIGSSDPPSALSIDGGTVNVNSSLESSGTLSLAGTTLVGLGANVTSTGNLGITGDVELGGTATVDSNGGAITFSSVIDDDGTGPYDLVVDAGGGSASFGGIIGTAAGNAANPGNLTVTAAGGVAIGGAIYLAGNLSVGAGTTIPLNADALDIGGSLTGTGTLTATTATMNIGGGMDVGTFNSGTTSTVIFDGGPSSVDGYTFQFLELAGGAITSNGAWTVEDSLTLSSGTWNAGAFDHQIAGNWDSSGITFNNGGGTISLTPGTPDVTAGDAFNNLTFDNGGNLLTGIDVNGDLTVTAGTLVTNDLGMDIEGSAAGAGVIDAGASAISIGVSLTVGAASDFSGAAVTFDTGNAGTANGYAFDTVTLGKAAAGNRLDLAGNWTVTTLNVTTGTLDTNALNLDVNPGTTTIGANGSIAGGGGTIDLATASLRGTITKTGGIIDLNGPTTLAAATTLTTGAGGGTINFDGAVDGAAGGENLSATSGTVNVNAAVGGGTEVGIVTLTGGNVNIGAGITATGNVTADGAVDLGATITTTSAGAAAIDFDTGPVSLSAPGVLSAVNGTVVLDVAVDGAATLSATADNVSTSAVLGPNLTGVTFNGTTQVTVGSTITTDNGPISLTGGAVVIGTTLTSNGGDITFTGPVGLTATTSVISGGGAIDFNTAATTINESGAGPYDLILTAGAGNVALDGVVGTAPADANRPRTLIVTSTGTVSQNAAIYLAGNLSVGAGTALGTGGNAIDIDGSLAGAGTIDAGASAIAIGTSLTIGAASDFTGAAVTFDTGIAGTANGYAFDTVTISKAAAGDLLDLAGNWTVTTLNVTTGTLDTNAFGLDVNPGTTTIGANGSIAGTTGTIDLATASLRGTITKTGGIIDLNGPTTLAAATILTTGAGGGTINFDGATDGAVGGENLSATSDTVNVNAAIGSGTPVGTLTIDVGTIAAQAAEVVGNTLIFSGGGTLSFTDGNNDFATMYSDLDGPLAYTDSDTLAIGGTGIATTNEDVTITTVVGDLTVNQPIDTDTGAGDIRLTSAGGLYITGGLSAGTGSIILNGSPLYLGGALGVNNPGVLTLNGAITLIGDTTLTTGGSDISIGATIDNDTNGPWTLTIDVNGGDIGFGNDIGTTRAPRSLDLDGVNIAAAPNLTLIESLTLTAGSYDMTAESIDVGFDIDGVGTLNVTGAASINVGRSFVPGAFNRGTSTVTLDEGENGNLGGYAFYGLTFAKDAAGDTITSTGGISVPAAGSLTMTQGTWDADNDTHTVNVAWDAGSATFNFTGSASTVVLPNSVSITHDAGTDNFNNLTLSNGGTLGSDIAIDGNLAIAAGTLDVTAADRDIVIAGNWTNGGAFNPRNGTVTFVGATSTLECGGSGFWNLFIDDSVVNVQTDAVGVGNDLTIRDDGDTGIVAELDVTATAGLALTVGNDLVFDEAGVAYATPILDLGDWSLDVANDYDAYIGLTGTTYELGRLRVTGAPANIDLPYAADEQLGIVEFYGGAANLANFSDGTADPTAYFWHMVINGCDVTLNQDIAVLGHSGAEDGALTEPVESNLVYNHWYELMGIFITAGGSLDANARSIDLYGSFNNTVGAAGFVHGDGQVAILGDYPALIAGSNTFYGFTCTDQGGGIDDVGGKILYFEQGQRTIVENDPGASFEVIGEAPPAVYVPPVAIPDAGSSWVFMISSNNGVDWEFEKGPSAYLDLAYVYLRDSDATSQPQVIPFNVAIDDCLGWYAEVYVNYSHTRDLDQDGRIDAILVTSTVGLKRFTDGAYDDVDITVDGYAVTGLSDGPLTTQFYIELDESDSLDTGATPAWRFDSNNTLIDNGVVGAPLSIYPTKSEEIPYDEAPPIIGYALAVADSPRNEVFFHFSEPLEDTNGGDWTNNFDTGSLTNGGTTGVTVVTPTVGTTLQEAIVSIPGPVTVADIYGNVNIDVLGVQDVASPASAYAVDATDPADVAEPLVDADHRISDIALGILGNGIVEPVVATGSTQPSGGVGVGIVTDFDGSDFLQDEDITLQAHLHGDLASLGIDILYDGSVPAAYEANGLWIPTFSEDATGGDGNFSGLVPEPWPSASSAPLNGLTTNLYDYDWTAADPEIADGRDLDFFFHFSGPDLYAARCEDDTASNWYRRVRPWTLRIRNVVSQAGGISILNNIINPNRNERTSLHYELTRGGTVVIQVFDLAGGLVEILQRGYQSPGEYSVSWNGRNRAGNAVARGIYFIRYVGPGGVDQIRKVLVVK